MASSPLFAYDMPDSGGYDFYGGVNAFNTGEAQKPFVANQPNYLANLSQATGNTNAQLKGQLPDDVINQIAQQAAERGVAQGSPLSQNSRAAYLKALGLNSLQMMQQGQQNFSQQIADTPVPQLFNPASLIVPERLASIELGAAMQGRGGGGGGRGPITPPLDPNRFGSPSLTNGNWNGNTGPTSASGPSWGGITPASGGSYFAPEYYGQAQAASPAFQSPVGDRYGGSNIDFGQFDEEDAYFADPGYGQGGGYEDASSPNFDWFN